MAKLRQKSVGGIRILTPPVKPDKARPYATSPSSGGRNGGGGGGGSAAPAYTFGDFYNTTRAAYAPRLVEIEDFDREGSAASLSSVMRPQYDLAIDDRERRTDTAKAELDADALARNMGTSAYVTDVKRRMHADEARDIAALEAQFGAEVERYLIEMEQDHARRKTEADVFNAGEWNDAMARAYDSAMALYRNYLASLGSGGGGRRKAGGAAFSGLSYDHLLDSDWMWDRIPDADKEDIYRYLEVVCTPQERDQIYYGTSPLYANIRAEILKALGVKGSRELHGDLPGNERYPRTFAP